jgi:hypothetical protein
MELSWSDRKAVLSVNTVNLVFGVVYLQYRQGGGRVPRCFRRVHSIVSDSEMFLYYFSPGSVYPKDRTSEEHGMDFAVYVLNICGRLICHALSKACVKCRTVVMLTLFHHGMLVIDDCYLIVSTDRI